MAGGASGVCADARVGRLRLGGLSSNLGVRAEAAGRSASRVLDRERGVGISVASNLGLGSGSGER